MFKIGLTLHNDFFLFFGNANIAIESVIKEISKLIK